MKHLLNLLAAIALLVWGTHLVRTGVLRVLGSKLRQVLAASMGNRLTAALSGLGVTALVQSSTATALITASFVGRSLITLPAALAVMLGADIGTSEWPVMPGEVFISSRKGLPSLARRIRSARPQPRQPSAR